MKGLLLIVWLLGILNIALAEDIAVTVEVLPTTTTTIPEYGLRATAFAIARINPIATILFILMPVVIAEFLIREFGAIRLSEPFKVVVRLLVIVITFALLSLII